MEFFRHCPECGRRFHIRLEDKRLVHSERKTVPKQATRSGNASADVATGGRVTGNIHLATGYMAPAPVPVMFEGKPFILESKEFQYKYKCGHCGHEWSEKHSEQHKES